MKALLIILVMMCGCAHDLTEEEQFDRDVSRLMEVEKYNAMVMQCIAKGNHLVTEYRGIGPRRGRPPTIWEMRATYCSASDMPW